MLTLLWLSREVEKEKKVEKMQLTLEEEREKEENEEKEKKREWMQVALAPAVHLPLECLPTALLTSSHYHYCSFPTKLQLR